MSELTDQERKLIVEEAIRLVERPECFVQGSWKCKVYETPKTKALGGPHLQALSPDDFYDFYDKFFPEGEEELVPATDEEGRQIYAYCAEGAINQAGINVLGLERARLLGAWDGIKENGEPMPSSRPKFAEQLSVNDLARVLYADLINEEAKRLDRDPTNMTRQPLPWINDSGVVPDDNDYWLHPEIAENAHVKVMTLLRKRLTQLVG